MSAAPARIALLYDHTLQVGGVENLLLALIRLADPLEFQFIVYAQASEPFASQAAGLGATLVDWKRWLPSDLRAPFLLADQLRRDKIDIVHCHAPIAAGVGRVAAALAGIPALVSVHLAMEQYHGSGQWLRARLGRWLYTCWDALLNLLLPANLIYVSETIRQDQVRKWLAPLKRTLVISPGVDLALYQQQSASVSIRAGLGVLAEETVMICVGRLEPQKGQDILLEACGLLTKLGSTFKLWLVGDGPMRQALQDQVIKLGLTDRVVFLGFRQDIPRLLASADLFVLPSRYEAAPVSVLEALAAGLPVVASATGEIPRWVMDGVEGRLVPINQPAALAAALKELLQESGLRNSMSAAARIRGESFDLKIMACSIYEQYHRQLPRM